MNQNRNLQYLIKRAKEISITKEDLDKFIPTDFTATVGDVIFPTSRVGRRAGRIKELASLAKLDPSVTDSATIKNPLTTDILSSVGGAIPGAVIGGLLGNQSGIKDKTMFGALAGAAVGGGLGGLVSRIIRASRINKAKKLIAQKGKIEAPELNNVVVKSPDNILDFGGTAYNRGRTSARQFLYGLNNGLTADESDNVANPNAISNGAVERILNLIAAPAGSLALQAMDRNSNKAIDVSNHKKQKQDKKKK